MTVIGGGDNCHICGMHAHSCNLLFVTDTPEFRDRGKRTFELVVHRNFVTEFRDYHFGTLELVTVVHQNFGTLELVTFVHQNYEGIIRKGLRG